MATANGTPFAAATARTILSKPDREFDKQMVLEEIQKRGGHHRKAAEELPDKVDHEQDGDLLRKFDVDPDDIAKSVGDRFGL